jgi:CheY-like chemotaxis protein
MSLSIRILVVDDDFATLDFLRSILALAQDDFDVLGVPSAEEALLELQLMPFRLLIADVRLPGMSGIELVRAAWEIRPELPVIMITAYTLSEVGQELKALGVTTTFRKPLDAEDFLEAVFAAVETVEPVGIQAADQLIQQKLESPNAVAERLDLLRTDTGARQVVMATTAGELLYVSGSQPEFDLRVVIGAMTESVNTSFRLANELDQEKPLIIQFLSGESCDVYFTNIGRDYFTAIFIDTHTRRGRIGTIWVFTQRAVRDIQRLLIDIQATTPDHHDIPVANAVSGLETVAISDEPIHPTHEGDDKHPKDRAPMGGLAEQVLSPSAAADDIINEPVEEAPPPDPLADDQFESLLAQIDGDEKHVELKDTLVDAFWDQALGTDSQKATPGLSLDEARDQGLIGPDFEIDED